VTIQVNLTVPQDCSGATLLPVECLDFQRLLGGLALLLELVENLEAILDADGGLRIYQSLIVNAAVLTFLDSLSLIKVQETEVGLVVWPEELV
jgi:hypothetical protein